MKIYVFILLKCFFMNASPCISPSLPVVVRPRWCLYRRRPRRRAAPLRRSAARAQAPTPRSHWALIASSCIQPTKFLR